MTVSTAAPARATRRGAKSPASGIPPGWPNRPRWCPAPGCWIARRTTSASSSAWTRRKSYDHVIIHTSTPSLKNDCKVAEAIKQNRPETKIGFVGAHAAVLPDRNPEGLAGHRLGRPQGIRLHLQRSGRRPSAWRPSPGCRYRDKDGKIRHNPERELIPNMDALPWVADVYKRDLQIEKYFIGYLLHPYVSLYTGRGCPAQCTFCLWPQTIGGHKYRVRSPQNVADEMAYMKKLFPQVKEFFFDDDTFTANLPRAREIARKLAPAGPDLELQQPRQSRLRHHQVFQGLAACACSWSATKAATRRSSSASRRASRWRRCAASPRPATRRAWSFTAPSSWACRSRRRETIENTIRFAQELDVFSIQVSLAAPYPGTELYEMARQNGWFAKKDKTDLVEGDGFQQSALEYPGLSKEEIFEAVDRFYRAYYLRPKPILRIIKTMLEDKDVCVRRCREGYEFFKSLRQRKEDLAAAKCACHSAPAGA